MRYIVSEVDKAEVQIPCLKIEQHLGLSRVLVDLTDQEARTLKEKEVELEPDYEILLKEISFNPTDKLMYLPILIATIGKKVESEEVSYDYDISSHKWREKKIDNQKVPWICCYSDEAMIHASDYLLTMDHLHQIAHQLGKTLIVIGHLESHLPYFRYDSLTHKGITAYLEAHQSVLILRVSEEELYHYTYPSRSQKKNIQKRRMYTTRWEEIHKLIQKALGLEEACLSRNTRQQSLYEDNFYNRIPPNQKIYVPLNLLDDKDCTYYQEKGLKTVCVGKNYTFIYDERQKIDALSEELTQRVLPTYMSPIFSPSPIQKETTNSVNKYQQVNRDLEYSGENVYIGIIGTQGVDYTKSYLRNESGTTRIAHIWKQDEGNSGTYYTADQINEALLTDNPGESVPLPQDGEDETLILQIAGGKDEQYEGIATKAEFVTAIIKPVPEAINGIYGGRQSPESVLMPDVLVAVYKLMEIARIDNKSLVLYIPYNTNISAHDGSYILEQILSQFARQQGYTFIIPTGEEGDKNHHVTFLGKENIINEVELQVKAPTPYLVGVIYIKYAQNSQFTLYSPRTGEDITILENKGVTYRGEGTIYSTGIVEDYNNGGQYILFSIQNMTLGTWTIKLEQQYSVQGSIDLWLSQQQLNPSVTLSPSTPFTTLGSNAAIDSSISVSGFDSRNFVVIGSAGRGFDWNETINPICASDGVSTVISENGWKKVQGTAVAGGILLGSVATLYEKWQTENSKPLPNSLIMSNIILSYLYQFQGVTYPDKSQGYGIFQLQRLPQLLVTPIP